MYCYKDLRELLFQTCIDVTLEKSIIRLTYDRVKHTYTLMHTQAHIYMYTHTHIYIYIYSDVCTCLDIYYIHLFIHLIPKA